MRQVCEMSSLWLLLALSSGGALIVNKYVLSVLHFTFPTVFQSWQVIMTCCVLRLIPHVALDTPPSTSASRRAILSLAPSAAVLGVSLCLGSMSLAQLPVALVVVASWLTDALVQLWQELFLGYRGVVVRGWGVVCQAVPLVVMATRHAASRLPLLYLALANVFSVMSEHLREKSATEHNLEPFTSVFWQYHLAALVLLPAILVLGDGPAMLEFEHLWLRQFHGACLVSGLLVGTVVYVQRYKPDTSRDAKLGQSLSCFVGQAAAGVIGWLSYEESLTTAEATSLGLAAASAVAGVAWWTKASRVVDAAAAVVVES